MTIYGLLSDFEELKDANDNPKVYRALHNNVTGLFVTVSEEDENPQISLFPHGAIVTKLIDVVFRLVNEQSNDFPVDDSEMVKLMKEQYEPGVLRINEDLSGKPVISCFPVVYGSSRYDAKEKSFKAYSRIRLTMNSRY